jgi:hypothetical protein
MQMLTTLLLNTISLTQTSFVSFLSPVMQVSGLMFPGYKVA